MALLLVLLLVCILVVLILAFFSRATSAQHSAANYHNMAVTRQLSDMAVNFVEAQINQAISECTGSTDTGGSGCLWVSQPGAIRVFGKDGDLKSIFKLYSADAMTAATVSALQMDMPPAEWAAEPSIWTDLNAPSRDRNGDIQFPILDIRDPDNPSVPLAIDGFELGDVPGANVGQPAPMPVRWLYILNDGTICTPGSSGGNALISQATKDNPIIGRIAYWTDDETCKVNINTASQGTFWDVPYFDAADERLLAKNQPARREYQRSPGHPATTSLNGIFQFGDSKEIFKLTPKYEYGGSREGSTVPTGAVPSKQDRLYASLDELMFAQDRKPTGLDKQWIGSRRFFLTAHSRAPELNIFGTPRVAIWPIHESDSSLARTTFDQLMAKGATVNGQPYYFLRKNPDSTIQDASIESNVNVLHYLDRLTSSNLPGFGSSFKSKYGLEEKRQILTEIFDFVRATNAQDSTLATPYASQRQIVPTRVESWGTQGFGRFYRMVEASMIFIGVGQGTHGASLAIPVNSQQALTGSYHPNDTFIPSDDKIAIQALFVMSFFDPGLGYSGQSETIGLRPNFTVEVTGLDAFALHGGDGSGGGTLGMASPATVTVNTNYGKAMDTCLYGGPMDWRSPIMSTNYWQPKLLGASGGKYPFASKIIEIPLSPSSMNFTGGTIHVTIRSGVTSEIIQIYDIDFPGYNGLPIARLATGRLFGVGGASGQDRFTDINSSYRTTMIEKDNDVVFSVVPGQQYADYRLLARDNVPIAFFVRHPNAGVARLGHGFTNGYAAAFPGSARGFLVDDSSVVSALKANNQAPYVPATSQSAVVTGNVLGDWDNGLAGVPDGPYIGRLDQGNVWSINSRVPYFENNWSYAPPGTIFGSPYRQISSPVSFGSLPTGVISGKSWRTLLFRPGPNGHPGQAGQPVSGAPPDHLLLDLFWMPVVEPYGISDPLATSGKVNLNYQILPFSYIHRSTAVRAVMADEKVAKIGKADASSYKTGGMASARLNLNLDEKDGTLRAFEEKFSSPDGRIFRTASEICDIFLVPSGMSWTSDAAARLAWYGDDFLLTGDNLRERPYGDLYPRISVKSNVFTVHYRVQQLKNTSSDPTVWSESKGVILGEDRGSTMIERYLDPRATAIPNCLENSSAASLDSLYTWRILEQRRFAP